MYKVYHPHSICFQCIMPCGIRDATVVLQIATSAIMTSYKNIKFKFNCSHTVSIKAAEPVEKTHGLEALVL